METSININHNFLEKKINSNPIKKNLIIGAITNYKWKDIAIYFKSFEKVGFENCDCVMFVRNMPKKTINKIKSFKVIIYKISNKFKNINIINCRWKIYKDFLKNNSNKYNLVFTADIRDVFFQKDIFKSYRIENSFLGVAIEDSTLSEEINKKWLIDAYGEELYKTIKNEKIICVGTIWGTSNKFYEFSSIMWENLSSEWSLNNNIIEQALTYRENINLNSENYILNGKKEIASVIHQYDRKPDIKAKIINKYYPEMKDIKSIENSSYFLVFIIDILTLVLFLIIKFCFKKKNKKKNKKFFFIEKDKLIKISQNLNNYFFE